MEFQKLEVIIKWMTTDMLFSHK